MQGFPPKAFYLWEKSEDRFSATKSQNGLTTLFLSLEDTFREIWNLPKKGYLLVEKKQRGISILSVPEKAFSLRYFLRLKDAVDQRMCDQHISFRAGRPCIDRILALRIIVQKLLELQLNLILCFLDFEEKCLVLSAVSPDRKFRILNHACQRSQRMARLENGGCRKGVCLLPIPILHRSGLANVGQCCKPFNTESAESGK